MQMFAQSRRWRERRAKIMEAQHASCGLEGVKNVQNIDCSEG